MWTKDRIDELEKLQRLLHEVSAINRGSHCLERIAKCIELADSLSRTDWHAGRAGFLAFLIEESAKE